jgi:hypothetical protein
MTLEELSAKILQIRKQYDSTQDNLLQEKIAALQILDEDYKKSLKEFADTYELDPYVQIVWNSDFSKYETAKRN